MSADVAGSGSGAHDDFPSHGAKTAFGLPIHRNFNGRNSLNHLLMTHLNPYISERKLGGEGVCHLIST